MKISVVYIRTIILVVVFAITVMVLYWLGPIAQDLAYHKFSDCRTYFGIPHFMDVVSNIPFLVVGFMGWKLSSRAYRKTKMVYFLMTITLFTGVFFTGIGSAFYHYAPNNFSLIFDRLPMTLVFTALFATVIYDYVHHKLGALAFYVLLLSGIYSIIYWYYTELTGVGDLRLYAFIQFFPVVAVPFILLFYRNSELYAREIIYAFMAYAVAKLFEQYDTQVFDFLKIISGHTIKHLFSAWAVYFIYQIYAKRITY